MVFVFIFLLLLFFPRLTNFSLSSNGGSERLPLQDCAILQDKVAVFLHEAHCVTLNTEQLFTRNNSRRSFRQCTGAHRDLGPAERSTGLSRAAFSTRLTLTGPTVRLSRRAVAVSRRSAGLRVPLPLPSSFAFVLNKDSTPPLSRSITSFFQERLRDVTGMARAPNPYQQ